VGAAPGKSNGDSQRGSSWGVTDDWTADPSHGESTS
jgi:hypothetical protein